jgi:protein-disulfide isomerase
MTAYSIHRRLFVGASLALSAFGWSSASADAADDEAASLGDPRAKVVVIEYASASCPHCAHFNNEVFPAFKAKYVDTGKVRYIMREILTDPTEVAAAAFLTARCAGKGKYFKVIDTFFRGQEQMYASNDVRGALVRAGAAGGLSDKQVDACVIDPAGQNALNARVENNVVVDHIESTPTFVINGDKLEGDHTLANLDRAIAEAQTKLANPPRRPGDV